MIAMRFVWIKRREKCKDQRRLLYIAGCLSGHVSHMFGSYLQAHERTENGSTEHSTGVVCLLTPKLKTDLLFREQCPFFDIIYLTVLLNYYRDYSNLWLRLVRLTDTYVQL